MTLIEKIQFKNLSPPKNKVIKGNNNKKVFKNILKYKLNIFYKLV